MYHEEYLKMYVKLNNFAFPVNAKLAVPLRDRRESGKFWEDMMKSAVKTK